MAMHKVSTVLALLELTDQRERHYANNPIVTASRIIQGARHRAQCLVQNVPLIHMS